MAIKVYGIANITHAAHGLLQEDWDFVQEAVFGVDLAKPWGGIGCMVKLVWSCGCGRPRPLAESGPWMVGRGRWASLSTASAFIHYGAHGGSRSYGSALAMKVLARM